MASPVKREGRAHVHQPSCVGRTLFCTFSRPPTALCSATMLHTTGNLCCLVEGLHTRDVVPEMCAVAISQLSADRGLEGGACFAVVLQGGLCGSGTEGSYGLEDVPMAWQGKQSHDCILPCSCCGGWNGLLAPSFFPTQIHQSHQLYIPLHLIEPGLYAL